MILADALSGISLLYVDTAPFIYYAEDRANYADKMQRIFEEVSNNRMGILTSAVTLAEILMKPMQSNDEPLLSRYRAMFHQTQGITVIAISPAAGEHAAQLRARYNLRTPDAMHVASAVTAGCEAFLTNDTGIKRVTEIEVLVLDELETDTAESESDR